MESLFSILMVVVLLYLMMRFGCGAHMSGGGCGHSSHRHNQAGDPSNAQSVSEQKQFTRDPVCGMEIERALAATSTRYGADTFYFCSKKCYWKFIERPEYFAEIARMEKRYIA
jgi:YHS domain-containing protein